ncbi:MAG: hypothetical protein ACRD2J_02670 [Thermoanaerobaculia bacterium]
MSSSEAEVTPKGRRTRRRLAAAVVLALVFLAGAIAGIVGDRIFLVVHERVLPPGGFDFFARHMVRRLDYRLDLTDAQEAQVRRILETRTERMQGMMASVHGELHGELAAAHEEIAAILTPEQREKFERMRMRHDH